MGDDGRESPKKHVAPMCLIFSGWSLFEGGRLRASAFAIHGYILGLLEPT